MTTYEELKSELCLTDDGDHWGSALSAWFEVAGALYDRNPAFVPAAWRFSPGIVARNREEDSLWQSIIDETETAVLVRFGNLLKRYVSALDHAGHAY